MAKTRAEIQRAYRERKKRNDPTFLAKEKLRQLSYRTPAAERSKKKQEEYKNRNKLYCAKYRQRKKEQTRVSLAAQVSSKQINEVPSSTDVNSGVASQTRSTENGQRLLVRLPLQTKSVSSKKRSRALRKARFTILKLKTEVSTKAKLINKLRNGLREISKINARYLKVQFK